jgi:prophage regulatory protein
MENFMAFMRLAQVLQETGLSKSTVYDLVKKGEFPSGIRLAEKAVGWVDTEVKAWQEERIKASRPSAL